MNNGLLSITHEEKEDLSYICTVTDFEVELGLIEDESMKIVVQNIMADVMGKYNISKRMNDYTKKVVFVARTLAESRGYTRLAKDVIISAALLHDLYAKKEPELHVLLIRLRHREELEKLDPAMAENICSMIEGHHGYGSIFPKIASKEGTIEQILTDASAIATATIAAAADLVASRKLV